MACNPNCSVDIATLTLSDCAIVFRKGSISFFAFQNCDSPFTDVSGDEITDIVAWTDAIAADPPTIHLSGEVVGQRPKGSVTKLRVSGCRPEQVVSSADTITFRDYNADLAGLSEFGFWNSILANVAGLNLMVVTCDDLVYFYDAGTWNLEISSIISETIDEANYMDGTINILGDGSMVAPVLVSGLNAAV